MSELFEQGEETRLRNRLLAGSVIVAFLSSAIFLAIAYRLASDLGTNLYLVSVKHQANAILERAVSWAEDDHYSQRQTLPATLQALLDSKDYQGDILQVSIGDESFSLGGDPTSNQYLFDQIPQVEADAPISLTDRTGNRFVVAKTESREQGIRIVLLKSSDYLGMQLGVLSRRLIIASFLVLWLAIWGALIVSGMMSKKFSNARSRLIHEVTHDSLTGLGNRLLFINSYRRHMEQRRQDNNASCESLIFIDLDNFKEVNDTAGPDVGDQLLIKISERLRKSLPAEAGLYRYGGDEFAIWLPQSDESQTRQWAEKLIELCHKTITIDDWSFGIGASAGVARLPEDGTTLKDLLRCADIALHQAKRLRTGISFFTSSNDPDKELKIELRSQLHEAIASNQFVLFYQPKVNLENYRIRGVEALARWMHPVHGLLPPYLFIDLVEQGGVVNLFSRYVLRQAIQQLRVWLDQGHEIPVAVNLSSYNLLDVKLVDYIRETLTEFNVSGRLLEIELTESAAMFDVTLAQDIFSQLHPDGVKVSIDDFGTGMSSLAHLKSLDVDYIKIDRSFISRIENSETDQAIVTCMIELCRNLQKEVVAEGVETAEQAAMLARMGCNQAQGYFFSKPVPAEDLRLGETLGSPAPGFS